LSFKTKCDLIGSRTHDVAVDRPGSDRQSRQIQDGNSVRILLCPCWRGCFIAMYGLAKRKGRRNLFQRPEILVAHTGQSSQLVFDADGRNA
jgi:hypothetical protein